MPVCRMEMGKSGWGLLLSHRRNSGWGSSTCSCSTNLSSWGIQLSDRWQLARNTQLPWNNQTSETVTHIELTVIWQMAKITQMLRPKKVLEKWHTKWSYLSHALFDHPGCYGSLSLPQGEGIEPLGHPTGLRQLDQGTCRVLYKYKEITRLLSIELLIL